MNPQPFTTLWENPTFANIFRTLPIVLTSSLFMLFGLLEVALACLKWMLFVLIITATFLFGLGLLVMFVLVLVGVIVGSGKQEGDAEVRKDAKEDMHAEPKVEQEEDTEEKATHSPPESAALDTSGVEETEDSLEAYWNGTSAEMGKDEEKVILQRASRKERAEMLAASDSPSPSPERRI